MVARNGIGIVRNHQTALLCPVRFGLIGDCLLRTRALLIRLRTAGAHNQCYGKIPNNHIDDALLLSCSHDGVVSRPSPGWYGGRLLHLLGRQRAEQPVLFVVGTRGEVKRTRIGADRTTKDQ